MTTHADELPARDLRAFEVIMAQLGHWMGPDLIVGEVSGPINLPLLRRAAYRVQQRHPGLRAKVTWPNGPNTRPRFSYHEPDISRIEVKAVSGGDQAAKSDTPPSWETAVEMETRRPFAPEPGYMFRITWVPSPDGTERGRVICCAHHSTVDGTSLMRLLDDLLCECASLETAKSESASVKPALAESFDKTWSVTEGDLTRGNMVGASPIALDPDVYVAADANLTAVDQLSYPTSIMEYVRFRPFEKLLLRFAAWLWIRNQRKLLKTFLIRPAAPLGVGERIQSMCFFRVGTQRAWQQLRHRCTERGVTVGGAFAAAIEFAVLRGARRLGAGSRIHDPVRLPMSIDYNMRSRLDVGRPDDRAIGLFTGVADIGATVPLDVGFWNLAEQLMASTIKQDRARMPLLFQGLTDGIFDLEEFLKRGKLDVRAYGGIADGINISNVGQYPYPTIRGPFELINVFGLNGACLAGPMLAFWIRHINEHLCYNAVGASPAVTRSSTGDIFNDLVDLLESCGQDSFRDLTLGQYLKT